MGGLIDWRQTDESNCTSFYWSRFSISHVHLRKKYNYLIIKSSVPLYLLTLLCERLNPCVGVLFFLAYPEYSEDFSQPTQDSVILQLKL